MSVIEAADIFMNSNGHRCCTLWLDEDNLDIGQYCLIDGIMFETVFHRIEFKDPNYASRHPYLSVDLEGGSYVDDWFIGKEAIAIT